VRARFTAGAIIASMLAGPLFVLPITVLSLVENGTDGGFGLVMLPLAMMVTVPFGFVISLIPNVMGAAVMASIGERNFAARHSIAWAASGLLFGAIIGALCWPGGNGLLVLGSVGLLCALVSRRFVVWDN
jgi:hypothetical protein